MTRLQARGTTVTVLDGVIFTLRVGSEHAVRDASGMAFALHDRGWRAFIGGSLRHGAREVATMGTVCHHGAFTGDGSLLWVLGPDHLHRITWTEEPRLDRSIALDGLAALFRIEHGRVDPAVRARLLDAFGSRRGVAKAAIEVVAEAAAVDLEIASDIRSACRGQSAIGLEVIRAEEGR